MKVGDNVIVYKQQHGNFIKKGSIGKIIDIRKKEHIEPNEDDGYFYNIYIDFSFIPGRITNKEEKYKDTYDGKYWVREDRLKLNKINNWREEMKNELNG